MGSVVGACHLRSCDKSDEIMRKEEGQQDAEFQAGLAIFEPGRMKLDK